MKNYATITIRCRSVFSGYHVAVCFALLAFFVCISSDHVYAADRGRTQDVSFQTESVSQDKKASVGLHEHVWETSYTVDALPSCTGKGKKSIHCSICGKRRSGSIVYIDAKGHDWSEWKVVTEPDVFSKGKKSRSCSVCGKVQTRVLPKDKKMIELSEDHLVLTKGDICDDLFVTKTGKNDAFKEAVCKSPNLSVTVLDKKRGHLRVHALKKGKAGISVRLESGKKKTVKVTVLPLPAGSVTPAVSSLILNAGKSAGNRICYVSVKVSPENCDEKVRWSSSDPDIVRVTQAGKITGCKEGSAVVTVLAGKASGQIHVTVYP